MTPAEGHMTTFPNPNPGVVSISASPNPVLFGPLSLTLCSGNVPLAISGAGIFPLPLGATFFSHNPAEHPSSWDANRCHTWISPDDFAGFIPEPGHYSFVVDTPDDSEFIEFDVSFLVVPESPIGLIAIIGSSLGVLAVFLRIKRKPAAWEAK